MAALVAITFLKYNSNVVELALFHVKFTLPPVVFAILTVILVWTSVNVTNCSDGVDGLSGTPVDHYDHVHLYRGPYEGRQ